MPQTGQSVIPEAVLGQGLPEPSDYNRRELRISDIMSREMVTSTPEDTVLSVAKKMSENNVSCVVVIEDETVVGIVTDKDILKGIAGRDTEFHRLRVGDRMSTPVEVVSSQASVFVAGKTMETKGIKRLPVVDGGRLAGIVTQTDITRGLISISPLRSVSDVMSKDVATVDTGATVAEAAQIMAAKGISCLITMHRNAVAGIVTEKDVLRRAVALHKDPMQTQVVDVMSFPLVSVGPSYSVLSAGKKMETMHLHRLVVMADNEIYGIVTQTDIVRAVRAELEQLQKEHQAVMTEMGGLVRCVMADLERLQAFLCEAPQLTSMHDRAARAHRPSREAEAEESPAKSSSL
ncbi:MAG: CBS domain-containing protein [Planctomycetota bacterium]|jgi:predicted transcriptional regulator